MQKEKLLNNRYCIRILKSEDVPILCNIQQLVGKEIVVFDLPEAEGFERKFLELEEVRKSVKSEEDQLLQNKENLPSNCTLVGDPLNVSFLTLEKLEKFASKTNLNEFDVLTTIETGKVTSLKAHLMSSVEALKLINMISTENLLEKSLQNQSCFALGDASGCQRLLFVGVQKNKKCYTSFKANYLGPLNVACEQLPLLNRQLNHFKLRKSICRCRFDVLKPLILFEEIMDFQPANFVINAEWPLPRARVLANRKSANKLDNLLEMPPDGAITTIKFKPGWMDQRIALTDRIYELKYLARLASSLKDGRMVWKSENENPLILERVIDLIEGAKKRLDAELVYPVDFGDRLWDVLKTNTSAATLKTAFQMIYDALRSGDFRVLVESHRTSSLAKMLRMRNTSDMIFPRLESITCLQMLVEIGLDRFIADLTYRFMHNEFLASNVDLEPFFLDSSAPIEDRINHLIPIHLALQSMVMIEKFVRLAPHEKPNMAKRLLAHFTSSKNVNQCSKEFTFEVSMEDIYRDKLKQSMKEWLLEKTYEKPNGIVPNSLVQSPGLIYEITHISKGLGFDHVTPFITPSNPNKPVTSPKKISDTSKSKDEEIMETDENSEIDNKKFYECVYLIVSSHSASAFSYN